MAKRRISPGPWRYDSSLGAILDRDREVICLVHDRSALDAEDFPRDLELGNIKAIADLPELLSTLEEIAEEMKDCRNEPSEIMDLARQLSLIIKRMTGR